MNLCIQSYYYQPAAASEAQDWAVEAEGVHVCVTAHGVHLHAVAWLGVCCGRLQDWCRYKCQHGSGVMQGAETCWCLV